MITGIMLCTIIIGAFVGNILFNACVRRAIKEQEDARDRNDARNEKNREISL
jgi:hypothetical protein